jgi:membrane protein YdbS with pleckstrin-like domain
MLMGFPAKLLAADEEIELDVHPHWKVLAAPAAALVAACGAAGFSMALVPEGESKPWLRWAVALLALAAIVRWAVLPWLNWLSTRYVVTSQRLIVRSGLLARDGRDMPLVRVDDVSFRQCSPLERLLGCGTLVVESSEQRGRVVLVGLPQVEAAQRDLYRLVVERAAARPGGRG